MKATSARAIAYENNKTAKGISETNKIIEKAAKKGKFEVTVIVHYDWGYYLTLAEAFRGKGFKVTPTSKQVSPNDSDYFLHISWE